MNKKIVIKTCLECPSSVKGVDKKYFWCSLSKKYRPFNSINIPKWCELEDE